MIAAVPRLMTLADEFIILEAEMKSHHGVNVTAVAAHDYWNALTRLKMDGSRVEWEAIR